MDSALKKPFLFKETSIDKDTLKQGDLLKNCDILKKSIKQAHSYYAEADDYSHFMVISQSCDLVRRNGKAKTNYITLAAVRPFDTAFNRLLQKSKFKGIDFPIDILNKSKEQEMRFRLERFINNTVESEGFFFISKYWHPEVNDDLCTFLQLSIALRTDHYEACLKSKVAELEEIFAAKVGWITGNLYSRVAITDLSERYDAAFAETFKKDFSKEIFEKQPPFLYESQLGILKDEISQWRGKNSGAISNAAAGDILKRVPPMPNIVAEKIISILESGHMIQNGKVEASKIHLSNNRKFKRLIKELTGEA